MPATHDKHAAPSPRTLPLAAPKPRQRRLQWVVPEDLVAKLRELAARHRRPNAAELKDAIVAHLTKHGIAE